MSDSIKTLLNGIINMTSKKSNTETEKRTKLFNLKTNVPEIDEENENLFLATEFLQQCGNHPGLTMRDFYDVVYADNPDITEERYDELLTAAIAIETMMNVQDKMEEEHGASTVH